LGINEKVLLPPINHLKNQNKVIKKEKNEEPQLSEKKIELI
jgi:hypothetical protein